MPRHRSCCYSGPGGGPHGHLEHPVHSRQLMRWFADMWVTLHDRGFRRGSELARVEVIVASHRLHQRLVAAGFDDRQPLLCVRPSSSPCVMLVLPTTNGYYRDGAMGMVEGTTIITRKGQITLPAQIRRALNLKIGDKVTVLLQGGEVILKPAGSVIARTAGAVKPNGPPLTAEELREVAEIAMAEEAVRRGG